MTDYEYALRTVTVASGQAFEIAHAVAPGTLVALCGTVAVPHPGSRWADSDPGARCEVCGRTAQSVSETVRPAAESIPDPEPVPLPTPAPVPQPAPEPEPAAVPQPAPEPEPAAVPQPAVPEPASVPSVDADTADRPGPSAIVREGFDTALARWRGVGRRTQLAVAAGLVVVVGVIVLLLGRSGGFHADPNAPAYKNGYAYGHDLMSHSNDVSSACTQATVDDPAGTDGKNFIAGCEAGYAARTP